jgi:hypothetical protein
MTTINDRAVPLAAEGTEPPVQEDALEHWLQDLRTDLAGEATGGEPFAPEAPEHGQSETGAPAARPIGRHRKAN